MHRHHLLQLYDIPFKHNEEEMNLQVTLFIPIGQLPVTALKEKNDTKM